MRRSTKRVGVLVILPVLFMVTASLAPVPPPVSASSSASPSANATVLQPAIKRDIYVFLDQFLDRTNRTTPAQILARLDAVDAYFLATTDGAWAFNWTLFYPTLGQPWYMVNETYAQAGANTDLTPLADVIMQAYQAEVTYPAPGKYPLVPSALIIHAGDDGAMTGNSSDIWSVTTGPYCSGTRTNPANAFCLLTAIVAETDPVGVIAHELTHELQRFDEFGNPMGITLGHSAGTLPTDMVGVSWWDPMYQGLRNPTGNASIPPGTYPAEYMAWNRMSLGFLPLSQIAVVDRGQSATVTLNDLEEPSTGDLAIRIPIVNTSLYHTYYFVELRKGISYDAYFPWLTTIFPDRLGMLIYWVNVSVYGEPFQIFLLKAHSVDATAQQALFGPCASPCVPSLTMTDQPHQVNVTIESTSNASFVVHVENAPGASTPAGGGTCPSLGCFLGLVNVGAWGLAANLGLLLAAAGALTVLAVRSRRRSRDRAREPQDSGRPR